MASTPPKKRVTKFHSVGLHPVARETLEQTTLQVQADVRRRTTYSQVVQAALLLSQDHPEAFRAYLADPDLLTFDDPPDDPTGETQ